MSGRQKPASALVASPTLIGAVTIMIGIVTVFLAYNANNGLPFVPTYRVTVEVPDAAEVIPGNEVRIGGARVGIVDTVTVVDAEGNEEPTADLALKLDADVEPLRSDTVVEIRQRSNLGLKYVELKPGEGGEPLEDGQRIVAANARDVVDLDDALNVFDSRVRQGVQGSVSELGDGLAGRGGDLNETIRYLAPTFRRLAPVARNLASSQTDLEGAIRGFQATTSAVAPVSENLAGLFDGGATTSAALAAERDSIGEILAKAPSTEVVGAEALRGARPVLADTAALIGDLRPGVAFLPEASTRLASALERGTPVLRVTEPLGRKLEGTLAELRRLASEEATGGALVRLRDAVAPVSDTLEFANPFQVQCNYLGLWTRNVPAFISQGDALGTWFRALPMAGAEALETRTQNSELHLAQYPDEGQNGECEAGNEVYLPGKQVGSVPGVQPGFTESTSPPPGTPNPPPYPVK